MDPLSGLLEAAVSLGVVEKRGARYAYIGDEKTWYAKDMDAGEILTRAETFGNVYLSTKVDPDEIDKDQVDKVSIKSKRKALVDSASE
jgi:hypothetical protein